MYSVVQGKKEYKPLKGYRGTYQRVPAFKRALSKFGTRRCTPEKTTTHFLHVPACNELQISTFALGPIDTAKPHRLPCQGCVTLIQQGISGCFGCAPLC